MNITNDQTMISAASSSSSSRLLTMKKKNRTTMSSSSSSLFSLLPEEIIIDEILLNLTMNSLLKLRCVSRYFRCLITSRSFVKRHLDHNSTTDNAVLLITCRRDIGRYRSKEVFQHYSYNFSSSIVNDPSLPDPKVVEMPCPFESAGVYGSCNGLLFLHGIKEENKKHGYIWNPCTKEYKVLPTPSIDEHLFRGIVQGTFSNSRNPSSSGFCGFSYDLTNDEYKILYHENRVDRHFRDRVILSGARGRLVSGTEFKLYTSGSDTWKNVTDNPYRSLFFGTPWKERTGILVNGALHWIMSSVHSSSLSAARNARIISFDMEKEEFRELQKPPYCIEYCISSFNREEYYYKELQVLQECLCLCQCPKYGINHMVEIWMLKDYSVKDSWTQLFAVILPLNEPLAIKYIKLLRFCENECIRMLRHPYNNQLVMHNLNIESAPGLVEKIDELTTRLVNNIDVLTRNRWAHGMMYKESLVSLNSGTYTIG